MKLYNEFCRILQIKYPIIQAGMAGGPAGPELVSAVSNAGGLGTLGAAYLSAEQIRESIRKIKQQTNRPFGVNLFSPNSKDGFLDTGDITGVNNVLNVIREQLQLPFVNQLPKQTDDTLHQQFQIVIEEGVPVISTAFGVLPHDLMEEAKRNNCVVTTMVTTVKEAMIAENAGSDIIIAQGSDAGGHRSTFNTEQSPNGSNIGTFSLVPQIADAVRVPVAAAGGIMDGRGLVAALALGAQGIQVGTAFLPARESGAHPAYKNALLESNEESTVITRVFSGRPARGIDNSFIREFERSGINPAPFPLQNNLTKDIRQESAKQNNPEYMALWAGQGTRMLRAGVRAEEVIGMMMQEANALLSQ
ncbi:NAD(P)H-dependent flavin oxidoreductase [Peribacillus sp. SCS-155]|uniref:NAD(P)H-dependent flavin oxidoreductase n=1 Tax=Peribacillus sedimenti TaxID=3115297 RepID=UPI003905FE51